MNVILETERLYLREFIPEDGEHFFRMNNDPEVIKYTGDAPFSNKDAADVFIQNYDAYSRTGIGRWAVIRKSDKEFIGWCGLKYNVKERVVDVGYRLYKHYWGNGYATESAKATIHYAFETLKYPFLVAHAHRDNDASHSVIRKSGMTFIKSFVYDKLPARLYRIENPDYTIKEITAEETWPVRHPVLRKGRPLKDVYMEADEKESTFHIGIYYKDHIVGVASFMEDINSHFSGIQSRLRGMAVLPEYRKLGLARLILQKGEAILKNRGRTLLWFNARLVAVNFYSESGYETFGDEFDIPLIGPHYLMYKSL